MSDSEPTPDFITYVEQETIPEEPARELVAFIEQNEPMKPWTILSRFDTSQPVQDVRLDVLRPLVLEGVLSPDADGNIVIYDKSRLETIV
jgi:hypothetical protein